MYRNELAKAYLDYVNNFASVARFAEVYGYSDNEAESLLLIAKAVFNNPHPEA